MPYASLACDTTSASEVAVAASGGLQVLYAFAIAFDTSVSVLTGRPYGGTGTLYRKLISPHISLIKTYDSRITALTVQAKCDPIHFMCVYMLL